MERPPGAVLDVLHRFFHVSECYAIAPTEEGTCFRFKGETEGILILRLHVKPQFWRIAVRAEELTTDSVGMLLVSKQHEANMALLDLGV